MLFMLTLFNNSESLVNLSSVELQKFCVIVSHDRGTSGSSSLEKIASTTLIKNCLFYLDVLKNLKKPWYNTCTVGNSGSFSLNKMASTTLKVKK
jgi:hypothetical protein